MTEKRVRFGLFELDFGRFQLLRNGHPVRLEGLPLQLLMFMVENQRCLVTRERIAKTLWGDDVFVDVEQGINTAVRKIRVALQDDSTYPKYLQTVVGRGYRFVARIREERYDNLGADAVESADGELVGADGRPAVSGEPHGQAFAAAVGSQSRKRP